MRRRAEQHIRKSSVSDCARYAKERGLTLQRLGALSGLSGKFIGAVERGDKSLSVDSLFALAGALQFPLHTLVDVRIGAQTALPSEEPERIYALMADSYPSEDLRRAYDVLRAMLGQVS
jgi:transcriptional regulator with XRE-family HTH domain